MNSMNSSITMIEKVVVCHYDHFVDDDVCCLCVCLFVLEIGTSSHYYKNPIPE